MFIIVSSLTAPAASCSLGIHVDLTAALAQLVGHQVEYGGIIAYMVWRIYARPQYCGYLYFGHL